MWNFGIHCSKVECTGLQSFQCRHVLFYLPEHIIDICYESLSSVSFGLKAFVISHTNEMHNCLHAGKVEQVASYGGRLNVPYSWLVCESGGRGLLTPAIYPNFGGLLCSFGMA